MRWASLTGALLAVAAPAGARAQGTPPAATDVAAAPVPDDAPPPPVEAPPVPAQPSPAPVEAPPPPVDPPPSPPPPPAEASPADPPRARGGIEGRLVDADTGEPIAGVVVEVDGRDLSTVTDADGRYRLDLEPGTYTLRLAGDLYQRHRLRDVVVRRGTTRVDARLTAEAIEEVVVVAPPDTATDAVQVVKRKKRATVSDAISAEQMSRSPDSSASDAAKRMVGATVQDNKYVVIRGLGGRYSLTTLNGVVLPSPDPDVPAAPLDLFPAAMLSNLTVNKTASPDMPASFAGGALSIETRSFPTRFTLKLRAGGSLDSETTFRSINEYDGGALDALGYDDGTRDLPSVIPADTLADGTDEQVRSFTDVWTLRSTSARPNRSLGITIGDTLERGRNTFGYFGTANYGRGFTRRLSHVQRVGEPDGAGGYLPSVLQLDDETGTQSASLGGMVTGGWSRGLAHQASVVLLYTHTAEDVGSRITGTDNSTSIVERTRLRFVEREMAFAQLVGESALLDGKAVIGWQASLAQVGQDEPDTRDLLRTQIPDGRYVIDTGSGSSERLFSGLGDTSGGAGLDLTVPLDGLRLKTGGSFLRSDRGYQARRFHFLMFGDSQFMDPEAAFADANAGNLTFYESTLPSDGYEATRDVTAAYALADVSRWERLRFVGGLRYERASLELGTASAIDLGEPPMTLADRTDGALLPSLNTVLALTGSTNLRAAYGATVARPNFREVAPSLYYDYVRRRAIGGNPELVETRIHNVDVRWESFLGDAELVAASVFYKRFVDPIEAQLVEAGDGQNVGFSNAAGATTYGLELEARASLGRLHPALSSLSVGANLALIGSTIDLEGAERRLQGQSPYVANLGLGYSSSRTNTQADVLYNVFGRRIEEVGTGGAGNVYEEPFHRLDVAVSQSLPRDLKLKLSGTNLLRQRVVRSQNEVEIFAYQVGTSVVASLELSVD